jgi:hypothetical protein
MLILLSVLNVLMICFVLTVVRENVVSNDKDAGCTSHAVNAALLMLVIHIYSQPFQYTSRTDSSMSTLGFPRFFVTTKLDFFLSETL